MPPKAEGQYRHWGITWNNPVDPSEATFPHLCDYTAGQLERGEETGTIHWQLYVYSRTKISWPALIVRHPELKGTFAKKAYTGDGKACWDYAIKEDITRQAGPFAWGTPPSQGKSLDLVKASTVFLQHGRKRCADEFPEVVVKYGRGLERLGEWSRVPYVRSFSLRPWQAEFDRLVQVPSDRHIHCLRDLQGRQGKSYLVDYWIQERSALPITDGKYWDVASLYHDQPMVVFALARIEPPKEQIESLARVAENLKDGHLTSSKGCEVATKRFKPPIVVFVGNDINYHHFWTYDRPIIYSLDDGQIRQEGPEGSFKA